MGTPKALYSKQRSLKQPLRTDSGSSTELSVLRFNYRAGFNCVCLSGLRLVKFRRAGVDRERLYNYFGQKYPPHARANLGRRRIIGEIETPARHACASISLSFLLRLRIAICSLVFAVSRSNSTLPVSCAFDDRCLLPPR